MFAALFMLLLVVWNTAEFALQSVRRGPADEILILTFTLGVLIFLTYVRSNFRWSALGALIANGVFLVFGIAGLQLASAAEGFGKAGPAVAAIFAAVATYYSFRAVRSN